MKKHCYSSEDATINSLDTQLTKIFNRYIARTLSELEETPQHLHKKIVKKQFWYAKDDIEKLINENS